ncbi:hypothetical protein M3Y97_00895000 [Aphelenchoides bicaudatus]|nr:hypothetical protein M3Y97_00895000 [Aphelenchoides bicaudatus]
MSSSDEEEPRPERQDTKSRPRISPPSKNRDDRRDKRHRSRSRSRSDEKKSSPDHRDKRDSRDYRDRRDETDDAIAEVLVTETIDAMTDAVTSHLSHNVQSFFNVRQPMQPPAKTMKIQMLGLRE